MLKSLNIQKGKKVRNENVKMRNTIVYSKLNLLIVKLVYPRKYWMINQSNRVSM